MRKLCLVPALLLAAASASAETPVKLWNDYVYNQPVESVKAEAGIFDCSQRGQQMFCRANVEFAGHKDWGEVFFFTNGRLKAVSLFAPALCRALCAAAPSSPMRPPPCARRA